jgi:hypothetical protein
MLTHKMHAVPGNRFYTHECVNNNCQYVETREEAAGWGYKHEDECDGTEPIAYTEKGMETFFGQLEQFMQRAEELRQLYIKAYPDDKEAKNSDEISLEDSYLSPNGSICFKGTYSHCGGCGTEYFTFHLPVRYFMESEEEALRKTAEEKAAAKLKAEEKARADKARLEREAAERQARQERETFERLKAKFEPPVQSMDERGYPGFEEGGTPLG